MKTLMKLLVLAICLIWPIGAAHACSCRPITPETGFDQAQYVFTGKVVKAEHHIWLIEVERVWKGHDRLTRTVELMDVYAQMDCAFFFKLGQRYVVFAVLAKGGRKIFFHPQACNWTRPLRSTRVPAEGNESLWLEDLIVREHGPGEPPRDIHS
jgi:Tissue inhibitor of metalloproteinase